MMKWKTLFTLALFAVVSLACSDGQQGLLEPEAEFAPSLELQELIPFVSEPGWESEQVAYDLFAGQDILVGQVLVSNTAHQLKVTYQLTGDWCLAEYHAHLFSSDDFSDVPQKNGNPIPGKFEKSGEPGLVPCQQTATVFFEIGAADLGQVKIAAHAVVGRPQEDCLETVWQIGDVEEPTEDCGGNLSNYADEFNWGEPAGICISGPNLGTDQPEFDDPFIVGTSPVAAFPYNSNFNKSYATDFDVQWDGGLPFGGVLTMSWSPGQSATEKKIISDGGESFEFTAYGTAQTGQGWFLDTYPLVTNQATLQPMAKGAHSLNLKQTQGDGTFWDWVRLDAVCSQEESAWGAGMEFPGKNWATYLTYDVYNPPVIAGLDLATGGLSSLSTSPAFAGAREFLAASYPGIVIQDIPSDLNMEGFDAVVVGSVYQNSGGGVTLDDDQLSALSDYWDGGGCLVVLTDLDPTFDPGNEDLSGIMGLTTNGGYSSPMTADLLDPAEGFTLVSTLETNYPGYFDGPGDGVTVAEFQSEGTAAGVWFETGDTHGTGFAFSDLNMFWNHNDDTDGVPPNLNVQTGFIVENQQLWLDVMGACIGS